MKKSVIITVVITFSLLIMFSTVIYMNQSTITGKAVTDIPLPITYSDEEIKALWDAVFIESSDDIEIKSDPIGANGVKGYAARKIKGTEFFYILNYFLEGDETNQSITTINYLNTTEDYINTLSEMDLMHTTITLDTDDMDVLYYPRESVVSSATTAKVAFESKINYASTNWTEHNSQFIFTESEIDTTGIMRTTSITGILNPDYKINVVIIEELTGETNCTPNWTETSLLCEKNETKEIYYLDKNNCFPGNNPSYTERPARKIEPCDYNNDGIIGNSTNLNININSSGLNFSQTYNQTQIVEIIDNNMTIISFTHNFSIPLNIKQIEMKKQDSTTATFGYLIVNGINESKQVIVDKISQNSNSVCIKQAHIDTISEVTADCNATDELIVSCPGTNNSITCNSTTNTFIVNGIQNSAIKELVNENCTEDWNCTDWGECINSKQTRTCTDANNCGTTDYKPEESQTCIECIPIWICTEWTPEKCPKNETQIRTCTDENNCGTEEGKPDEEQTCDYTPDIALSTIIIVIIGAALLFIIILIVMIVINRKKQPQNPQQPNVRI